jgi:GNAT superfamily N-acetyltransferase
VQKLELKKLEGKEIFVRNASLNDREGLARVIQDTWDYRTKEWGSEKRDINQRPERLNFLEKSILEPEKTTVLLVTVDGEVAGFIHLENTDKNVVIIDTLFSLEKYRGAGIGYSLLSNAESVAHTFNAEEIHLGTHICNKDALRLYQRNGYEESKTEKPRDEGFKVKGKPVQHISLVKHLK